MGKSNYSPATVTSSCRFGALGSTYPLILFKSSKVADATAIRSPNGTIYSAHNAVFAGRSSAQYLWLSREGRVISRRSLNKIIDGDTGHAYVTRQLLAAGAPRRESFEPPKAWLERVLPLIATRVRHPGNFVFTFGLDSTTRRQLQLLNGATPYPKVPRAA